MKKYFLIILAAATLMVVGCKDDKIVEPPAPEPAAEERTAYNVPADTGAQNKTTYFRFSDSTIVTGADTVTNKWDIAFKSTTIYTNSGSSGPGQGGAVVFRNSNFEDVQAVPDTGINTDAVGAPAVPTGSGNGWYNYNFSTNLISPVPGVVIVIRTGEGKYAKVQILSYYKDAPSNPTGTEPSRYYTFKYLYQPDGSKSLE
ncbi:MAG: HmuY family protein [Ignavibacteriaceae bacterium]